MFWGVDEMGEKFQLYDSIGNQTYYGDHLLLVYAKMKLYTWN